MRLKRWIYMWRVGIEPASCGLKDAPVVLFLYGTLTAARRDCRPLTGGVGAMHSRRSGSDRSEFNGSGRFNIGNYCNTFDGDIHSFAPR